MTTPNTSLPKRTTPPGRIDFDVDAFDTLIGDHGVRVRITPAMLCPNRDGKFSTNHALDCQICEGNEAIDLDSKAFIDFAFIQNLKLNHDWQQSGIFDIKDAMISVKANVRLWYYYKIEVLDHTSIFNELIERTGPTDKLRYNAQDKAEVTPIYVIDRDGIEYIHKIDFTILGQTLTWVTVGPGEGRMYTIQYPILPIFRVLELPHENRYYYETQDKPTKVPTHLPQQAVIRWDYFTKGSGANGVNPPP